MFGKPTFAALIAAMMCSPAYAGLKVWQQNFVGCSTSSSPYSNQILFKNGDSVRPLMQIDGMNAWAVKGADGKEHFALTTPDGLTIYGKVIGPEGEDISKALLATRAAVIPPASAFHAPVTAPKRPLAPPMISAPVTTPDVSLDTGVKSTSSRQNDAPGGPPAHESADHPSMEATTGSPMQQTSEASPMRKPVQATPAKPSEAAPPSPQTMASVGSQTLSEIPHATSLNDLYREASHYAMWFPLDTAKPGAPVVYMLVDPTCPHCAWSIDHLKPKIRDRSVAFRVIFTPILSQKAFRLAVSIIQQQDIQTTLINQMESILGGGKPARQIPASQYDSRVVAGIRRNLAWMRGNGIPGVPFYLYRTKNGAQFALGALTDAEIASALPEPDKTAGAAQ